MTHKKCGDFGGKKRRTKTPCSQPAGWGTDHAGEGRCKLHGGSSTGRPIIHGRYSVKHRESLQSKTDEFLNDPEPGNLMSELALARAFLQDFLDRVTEGSINKETREHLFDMIESVGKLVERISRILNQTALTQGELQFLQARLVDLVIKYIDDPNKQAAFLGELRASVGSDRFSPARSGEPAHLTD